MLVRKLFRTAWNYKSQFISMIIMITLGIGIFLGFNMEWYTIEYDTSRFFSDTNYADYRLYSKDGFTSDELHKIMEIDGVKAATRYISVNLDIKGSKNKSLALDVSENYTVSTFIVTDGEEYNEKGDGFWLSDKFAAANDISLGDELTLVFQGTEISGKVVGLIKAGEHMICIADNNQLMPDYSTFGYVYISPERFRTVLTEKVKNTYSENIGKINVFQKLIEKKLNDMSDDEILDKAYGSSKTYTAKVIGYNRSIMTESVTMTDTLADELGIDYHITSVYTDKNITEIPSSDIISGKQDKAQLMDTFNSFVGIMDAMVVILVIAAVILGIVVLYNLGIMSYVERSRELATLKVLGFRNKSIGRLLISQNIWLTITGIIIGLPAGVGALEWMLAALAGEYEMKLMLGPMTYCVSVLLTFCVSLLVGMMVARKNKKIDMVEALKISE